METNTAYVERVATAGKWRPLPLELTDKVLEAQHVFKRGIQIGVGGFYVNSIDLDNYLSSQEQ